MSSLYLSKCQTIVLAGRSHTLNRCVQAPAPEDPRCICNNRTAVASWPRIWVSGSWLRLSVFEPKCVRASLSCHHLPDLGRINNPLLGQLCTFLGGSVEEIQHGVHCSISCNDFISASFSVLNFLVFPFFFFAWNT